MRFVHDTQTIARDYKSAGLKVLAAGSWRCATSSLQITFERILSEPQQRGDSLAPSLHGAYIMPSVPLLRLCCDACREPDREKRQAILRKLFDGYNASSGWPGFLFVDDLIEMYPDVKIVLNQRSSLAAWERSVNSTLRFYSTRLYLWVAFWIPQSFWHHQGYIATKELFKARHGIEDIFSIHGHNTHKDWVRVVARQRGKNVLEWAPKDGWIPLCDFLDKDVPSEAFPASNESETMWRLKRYLVFRGLLAWGGLGLSVLVVIVAARMK